METSSQPDIELGGNPAPGGELAENWRDPGYPGFSKWMASSHDFLVFRRFGQLNVRVLLMLQDDIVQMEDRLNSIDEDAKQATGLAADSSCMREDAHRDRVELLRELAGKLKEYNDFLTSYSQVKTWSSPQKVQVKSVKNWFHNYPGAIEEREAAFIDRDGDLVRLVDRPKSHLQQFIEKSPLIRTLSLFRAKPQGVHVTSATTSYHSTGAIKATVFVVIMIMGLLLLLGPIWALKFLTDSVLKLVVITVFILVFTVLLSSATVDKPFEVLAATAAYSAVLVVFVQVQS